jgi:exosortase A-associated hydrolase 2
VSDAGVGPKPFFMAGAADELFAVHYPPSAGVAAGDGVLFIPPFAEEMNKCRRMCAIMARHLSTLGYGSLLVDLYGTGDSRGDFGDARWELWRTDLMLAVERLVAWGHQTIHLIAVRLGALLAADLESAAPCSVGRLILWHPVTNGEQFMTQFLRLRTAATMMEAESRKEKPEDLRRELRSGQAVEIGGYRLSPDLALAIEKRTLAAAPLERVAAVHWLDVAPDAERPLSPASVRCIEALRQRGRRVSARTVAGEPFWSTVEIAAPMALLDATSAALAQQLDDA